MIKVYYQDIIPKKNNRYQWGNTAGLIIPFEFDGKKGELEILEVIKDSSKAGIPKFVARSSFGITDITTVVSLKKGHIQKFVRPKDAVYYGFEVGQIVKNERANIQLLEKKKTVHEDRIEYGFVYKCLDCGFVGYKIVQQLVKGDGCKYYSCRAKNLKESRVH